MKAISYPNPYISHILLELADNPSEERLEEILEGRYTYAMHYRYLEMDMAMGRVIVCIDDAVLVIPFDDIKIGNGWERLLVEDAYVVPPGELAANLSAWAKQYHDLSREIGDGIEAFDFTADL